MSEYWEHEQTLISQILAKPSIIDELLITPDLFKENSFKEIFSAIERARLKTENIDVIMVYDELSVEHKDIVPEFARITPAFTAGVAKYYYDILTERNMRDGLVNALNVGLEESNDHSKTAAEVAEVTEQKIASAMRGNAKAKSPLIRDSITQIKANFEKKLRDRKDGNIKRATFGIPCLDEFIAGMRPNEVIAIGARPSVGKSAMGLQIFMNIGYALHKPVMFISLEMSRDDLMERMAAAVTEIPYSGIRDGALNQDQADSVKEVYDAVATLPMSILDCSEERLTLPIVKAHIRREKTLRNVEVVIIDYLGLLDVDDGRRARWERMVEITNSLKLLAVELGIVIIELAQLSRLADGKEPTMADLRDSGSVEQDADGIVLLHPQGEYDTMSKRQVKAIVAKRRNGKVGSCLLLFDGNRQFFTQDGGNARQDPIKYPDDEAKRFGSGY